MNGNPIINIANGVEATDAVNVSQLRQTQSQINAVQKESRVGVSGVAALVGLPDIPAGSDGVLGVGTGTHKGESTLAIGGARQINEKATLKFGLSTPSGNGGTVGSFGVGIKW
jgi:autotransporter adhesin